jgi:hypothetical protein
MVLTCTGEPVYFEYFCNGDLHTERKVVSAEKAITFSFQIVSSSSAFVCHPTTQPYTL